MTKTMILTSALAALLLPATGVRAQQPIEVRVSTEQLDLHSGAGRAELEKRARLAAIDACGVRSPADRASAAAIDQCRADVVEQVRRASNRERLASK